MSDILAKIKLLDDPDESIYQTIKESLIKEGSSAIPILEETWTSEVNPLVQERIEEIIKTIQFTEIKNELFQWKHTSGLDLAYGAYLIAKYFNPDCNWNEIDKKLDQLKKSVWVELNQNLTALEKIRLLNHLLFDINHFKADTTTPNNLRNFLINNVLDTKQGNALSLSILYISIAQRLNLPVFGVDLPKNFICCYVDKISAFEAFGDSANNAVLFYINPFNRGSVFGRKEIDYFLDQAKLEPQQDFYSPCSNIAVIIRLISNLTVIYKPLAKTQRMYELNELSNILYT